MKMTVLLTYDLAINAAALQDNFIFIYMSYVIELYIMIRMHHCDY